MTTTQPTTPMTPRQLFEGHYGTMMTGRMAWAAWWALTSEARAEARAEVRAELRDFATTERRTP